MVAVFATFTVLVGFSLLKDSSDLLVQSAVFRHGFCMAESAGVIEVGLGVGQKAPSQGANSREEIPLGSPRYILRVQKAPHSLVGIDGCVAGEQTAGLALGGGSGGGGDRGDGG
jgi:hypothetical protein